MSDAEIQNNKDGSSSRHLAGVNRRSSLGMAEAALGDLFGRRASGFSDLDVFGRRGSLDSTSAVLDAAIMDLTRRRLSMAMGMPGEIDAFGGGFGGVDSLAFGGLSSGSLAPVPMESSSTNRDIVQTDISAQQRQIQEQQRELERRQKELEIQRQKLLAAMEERRIVMQQMQQKLGQMSGATAIQRNSLLGNFGGGMGNFGSSNLLMGLGGRGFSVPMGVPAAGANPPYPSLEEAAQHEALCMATMGARTNLGLTNAARRSSFDLLMGTMERPDQLSRLSSFRDANARRDSLSMGIMNDRRFSLIGDTPNPATELPTLNTMSSGPFEMMDEPLPLAMDSDKDWLTPLHCFVRQHCVHVFTATEQDVATPSKGKRKPIKVGQVGIRCPHCHHDIESSIKARERGSVYYPQSIGSIYNATMNLLQRHLHSCTSVPPDIMRRYETLKADDARSGTSKKYWVESALKLGLVDTENGIRYSGRRLTSTPNIQRDSTPFFAANDIGSMANHEHHDIFMKSSAPERMESLDVKTNATDMLPASSEMHGDDNSSVPTGPLVRPEDELYATAFSFHLLRQMQPCVFTEADRLGKRKGLPPGFPGLACRHCFGGYGSGRFFPSSIKTLSDTSKTLNVLHNHMMRCRKCPPEIRETLNKARKTHDEQRAKMKFGSQKAFFARIWDRLHYKDPNVTSKRKFKPKDDGLKAQSGANSANHSLAMHHQQQQQQQFDEMNKRQKL